MVFYVIAVIFLMILLMNGFTKSVVDDWKLDEIHAKFGIFSILTFL